MTVQPQEQERRRRSFVWAAIEWMAFQPKRAEDWISLFERTIHKLWQVEPGDVQIKRGTSFELPFPRIVCAYCVEKANKYNSSIRLADTPSSLLFTIHDNPAYPSRAAFHKEIDSYPWHDCARYLQADVANVLDGMIFHPRVHTHIKEYGLIPNTPPPQQLLDFSEIRIGGGIENAFVFLFHLRYQFCLVSEDTRKSEKNRLVNLFAKAIKDKETHVPASELFDFRS